MPGHGHGGLLVTLGLAASGLLVAANPAVPAFASGPVCAGIVIDDGTGGAPLTQGASVPSGSSDLDLLKAAGDTFTPNDSGLVCAINGYPVNGSDNCLRAHHGLFYYWSYWEGDPATNTWTYANVGPGEHTVTAGQSYVEGWRYQDPGPDSPAATKPSVTPAAAFAQACQRVPPTTTTTTAAARGRGGSSATTTTSAAPTLWSPTTAVIGTGPGTPRNTPGSPAAAAATTTTTTRSRHGAGDTSNSTTSTSASETQPKPKTSSELALASPAAHRVSGGDSALPLIVVAVIITMLGVLAWLWWRRRPAEE